MQNLAQIAAAGIVIINILQVYNWFNEKYINTMIGFYFLAQFLGYMVPLPVLNSGGYWAAQPECYYVAGSAMIFLGVLDHWTFSFNPLQKNIFLDKEKGAYRFYRTGSAVSDP